MSTPPWRSPSSAASRATALGVGDVEHPALDPARVPGARRPRGGVGDPLGVPAGEQDQVVRVHPGGQSLDEGEADALVGAGDQGDACDFMPPRRNDAGHESNESSAQLVCVNVMDFTDVSLVALRVFREVAERGTFTAAAAALGLHPVRGVPADRRPRTGRGRAAAGAAPRRRAADRRRARRTAAGAPTVLDQIDATARELAGLPARGRDGPARLVPQRGRRPVAPGNHRAAPQPPGDHGHHPGGQHARAGPGAAGRHPGPRAAGLGAAVPAAGRRVARA